MTDDPRFVAPKDPVKLEKNLVTRQYFGGVSLFAHGDNHHNVMSDDN